MSIGDDHMEPVTDLGLALGHSSEFLQRRLNIESGAGVNAGLRINVPFLVNSPLSELVWSPHKGLILKCAENSFMDRRPSILKSAGPSNVVLSPTEKITASTTSIDRPMDENFLTSKATLHVTGEVAEGDSLSRYPRSEAGIRLVYESSHEHGRGTGHYMDGTNTVEVSLRLPHTNQEDLRDSKGKGLCDLFDAQTDKASDTREENFSSLPGQVKGREDDILSNKTDKIRANNVQMEPLSGNTSGGRDIGSGNQTLGMEIVLASEVHTTNECETDNQNKIKSTDTASIPPLEKMESTDENDIRTLIGENAYGMTSKVVPSEYTREAQDGSQKDEEALSRDKTVSAKHSPANSRVHRYRRKGKEKALSDGDVNGRMSEKEDSSHESVESCNSAGLFPTGKTRWSFEQLLIMQSKRAKKEIQESPGSTSFVRQDSSFMNWISNMMKGFAKSNEGKAPSVALAHAQPHQGQENTDRKLIMHEKAQDPGCRSIGFQSIFKSLYCSNKVIHDSRLSDGNYQKERSKDTELCFKTCDIDVTPIAYHRDNSSSCKQFMLSNEKLNESISKTGVGPSTMPQTLLVNSGSIQENCKTSSAENKNSYNLALGTENEGMSSKSSLGKRKTNSTAENDDSDLPSEGKRAHKLCNRSDALGSLWITRFSPKTSGPLSCLDHFDQSIGRGLESTSMCMKLDSHPHNNVGDSDNQKILEAGNHSTEEPLTVMDKELQNATNPEDSAGLNRVISGHNDQNLCKLNSIIHAQRLKSSEAMASVFARRLDALKHIIPSGVTDDAARAATTCFFCGIGGHHLRECPEITETELEDLLRNINLHGGAEESSFLCIRCFQLNHWAVACPNASREPCHQLECSSSLAIHGSTSRMQHSEGSKRNLDLPDSRESGSQAVLTYAVCDRSNPRTESEPHLKHKLNEMVTSDKMISGSTVFNRCIASSSVKHESREIHIGPLSTVNRQISDIPKRTFDAIRRLRLSRTDILKVMNSQVSLSCLNGFFLRLRLGKWEEGLGGTGYYVACIAGSEMERLSKNARNAIPVNVGGIKCLVESQYISNHDFREDELMAWWTAALRNGGKIPSTEDLTVKIQEKKMLGF